MFGYLGAPCGCAGDAVRAEYRRYFCGLCNVLARDYGPMTRWLINRDSTALALLWGAQIQAEPVLSFATCCNPWGTPRPLVQTGPGIAFAAAVTLAGLETYARDQRADEPGLSRWMWAGTSKVGKPLFRRAQQALGALGFDLAEVAVRLAQQAQVEHAIGARQEEWREAAEPTAAIFAAVVGHQALLAGNEAERPSCAALGRELGRAIYWLDACEDFARDRARGRFNPLPQSAAAEDVLLPALDRAAVLLDAFPLARHRQLLTEVLIAHPQARARQLLAAEHNSGEGTKDGECESKGAAGARRRAVHLAPGCACEQQCAACGDCCTIADSCCQGVSCCSDCCDKSDCNCCEGSCDCPCDSGGNS